MPRKQRRDEDFLPRTVMFVVYSMWTFSAMALIRAARSLLLWCTLIMQCMFISGCKGTIFVYFEVFLRHESKDKICTRYVFPKTPMSYYVPGINPFRTEGTFWDDELCTWNWGGFHFRGSKRCVSIVYTQFACSATADCECRTDTDALPDSCFTLSGMT